MKDVSEAAAINATREEVENIKEELTQHIDNLSSCVRRIIPQKGDTTEYCQLVAILNAISALDQAVTGLEASDFQTDDESNGTHMGFDPDHWVTNVKALYEGIGAFGSTACH